MRIIVSTTVSTVVDVPGATEFEDAVATIKRNDFALPSTDGLAPGWELAGFSYAVEGETAPAPVIEILHERDPDAACQMRAWLNGEEVEIADEIDVDPGAGHTSADWQERIEDLVESNNPFHRAGYDALIEFRGNKYILEND